MSRFRIKELTKKYCNSCKKIKTIGNFNERKNDHGTKIKYYNAYCGKCMTDRSTKWRLENTDRYNATSRRNYHRNKLKKNKSKRS